ncbi:MAG: P-loop NTPase fold protein [bacterium]|nr:P-loop NTPase fold protein [bacterium]
MRLSPPQLVITDEDGFEKHDTFGAKEAGERLANVVADLEDHSVIVLDGQWGSGKSVFVQQWAGLMRQRGHPVVYLDAFAADHHDDAFFAILGALLKSLQSATDIPDHHRKSLVRKIKGAARLLIPAVPTVVDVATGLPLGSVAKAVVDAARAPDDGSPPSDASTESFLDRRLRRVQEQEESVESFKKALNDVVEESPDSETPTRPLIFIIDELDRCKPSFALNVLERMKHIFAAEGICFMLVTHLEALAEMVRHTYGLKAANRYLDKFFHLRLDIDQLLASGNKGARAQYIRHIHKSLDVPEPAYAFTERAIQNLAAVHDLPFRSLERVLLNVALYAKSGGYARREGHLDGVAELCVMKLANAKLYHDARNDDLNFEEVARFLSLEDWKFALSDRQSLELWWRVATDWSTDGADGDVVRMMTERAEFFGASLDQEDIRQIARRNGYDRWLSDICRDIDLFWQTGNA